MMVDQLLQLPTSVRLEMRKEIHPCGVMQMKGYIIFLLSACRLTEKHSYVWSALEALYVN